MSATPFTAGQLTAAAEQFPTPFHLYSEALIRQRVAALQEAFAWNPGFREYFAVKATPNPAILRVLSEMGCGGDCASETELLLADRAGMTGERMMFTSNNTTAHEFQVARNLGAIINLDAANLVDYLAETAGVPDVVSVRYSPSHEVGASNAIIGEVQASKFGMTRQQVFWSLARLRDLGATRFGVHCMAASNSLSNDYYPALAAELFGLAIEIKEQLGIEVEFLNFAGGLGIPYLPEQTELDLAAIGAGVQAHYERLLEPAGLKPAIFTELGRYITGPAGVLVTRVLHRKETYRNYVGVDSSAVDLLRPAMYGAYHDISVVPQAGRPAAAEQGDGRTETVDVVGSLCENNDKFAIERELPVTAPGDLVVVHDAGAHGRSMGYNYNGKLRCGEVLWEEATDSPRLIRRAETMDDYFATLDF